MKEINKQNCAFHSKMRLRASMDGRCATSRVMPSHRQATESLFCHCGAEVSLQELPFTKDRNGETCSQIQKFGDGINIILKKGRQLSIYC